jgi:hypothetical protein
LKPQLRTEKENNKKILQPIQYTDTLGIDPYTLKCEYPSPINQIKSIHIIIPQKKLISPTSLHAIHQNLTNRNVEIGTERAKQENKRREERKV